MAAKAKHLPSGQVLMISPALLEADPGQPRQSLDREKLESLKESITETGRITMPLHVRPISGGRYRITAGMRRWTAASELGLATVPVIIDTSDQSYLQRRIEQMVENSQRAELTDLEKAQGLMLIWLAKQVESFETKASSTGAELPEPTEPFDADATPAGQITALAARVCQLAGVPSLDGYIGGGKIEVPWQRVLQVIGESHLDARKRKRLLELLDLAPAIQDQLIGIPLAPSALKGLQHIDTDEAATLIDAAKETSNPAETIAQVVEGKEKERKAAEKERREAEDTSPTTQPTEKSVELDGPSDDREEGDDADSDGADGGYDLNEGSGMARHKVPPSYTPKEDTRDVPLPGKGSTPPEQDGWDADSFVLLLAALESADRAIGMSNLHKLSDLQQRQIRSDWRSLVECMVYSGMELPEWGEEVDELRWS